MHARVFYKHCFGVKSTGHLIAGLSMYCTGRRITSTLGPLVNIPLVQNEDGHIDEVLSNLSSNYSVRPRVLLYKQLAAGYFLPTKHCYSTVASLYAGYIIVHVD